MRVVYMANVGQREVQRRNGPKIEKPRVEGTELLRRYEEVRQDLVTPILSKGIAHVLTITERVDRVQLFVSDQPRRPKSEHYWEGDTIEFGRLLRRLLSDQFGARIGEIHCEPMPFAPHKYNESLPFFATILSEIVPRSAADIVYIAPVGGTDACNMGLSINAVRLYGKKCQFIYVTEKADVDVLNLHKELLGDYAREEAKAHLASNNYLALRETMVRSPLGETWHQHLCDYADRRSRFDFARAKAELEQTLAVSDSGQAKLQLGRLAESLRPFLTQQQPPTSDSDDGAWMSWFELQRVLLGELFFNLRLKARQGAWVDFLGRLFRMREALLRLAFETAFRHSTEKRGQEFGDFVKAIEADEGLLQFMKSKLTESKSSGRWGLSATGASSRNSRKRCGWKPQPRFRVLICQSRNDDKNEKPDYGSVNHYTLGLALEYLVTCAGRGEQFGPVHKISKQLASSEMVQLRNKSIVAHGYEGVSREDVERAAGVRTGELIERLRHTLAKLGVDVGDQADPYAAADSLFGAALA